MSEALMTVASAGWFRDSAEPTLWRWWDGATWTHHVQPIQPPPPPTLGRVVSLTPATPASEQEYWHSAAAEIVQLPRRAATTNQSAAHRDATARARLYSVPKWGAVGSPHTVGIWMLALLPLIGVGLQLAIASAPDLSVLMSRLDPVIDGLALAAAIIATTWIFVALDTRTLGRRGYRRPSTWWMLLAPPLAYFIARGKAVRAEGQRAWPPELLFFFGVVSILVMGFAEPVMLALDAL